MAQPEPKPLAPMKQDFLASLDSYMYEAGMLAGCVRAALDRGAISGTVADLVRERLSAFDKIRGAY